MATESLRSLETAVEAWNRRDIDAVMERVTEDVVWRTGGLIPDISPVYEGHEGLRRFFRDFFDPWEEISTRIEDVIDDREDQVVVRVSFHARGREGIEVDGNFIQIYRYDERHRCREFQAFAQDDERAALREAGLDD